MTIEPGNPQLRGAIELFNQQEYFACHDELEELWGETLGEEREFLQGLIHAAVALHHFSEGNLGGARKMHDSAVKYLRPYHPVCLGIDLERFLTDFDHCFDALLGEQTAYPVGVVIDPERLPKMHFVPGVPRGPSVEGNVPPD